MLFACTVILNLIILLSNLDTRKKSNPIRNPTDLDLDNSKLFGFEFYKNRPAVIPILVI